MKKYVVLLAFLFLINSLLGQEVMRKVYAKKVDFSKKIFTDSTYFYDVQFSGDAYFSDAQFTGNASFLGAKFSKEAIFDSARFSKHAFFLGAKFSKDAVFYRTNFLNGADFTYAKFSEYALFSFAKFVKGIDLSHAQFSKGVAFNGSSFDVKGLLNLSNLVLNDTISFDFSKTSFPDTILFANNNIKNEINFTNADFLDLERYISKTKIVRPIWIYLLGSDLTKLRLDYFHFRLLLPDSTIEDNRFAPKKAISDDEKAAIYLALLNNFKLNGQPDSYKLLDIEYQQFRESRSYRGIFGFINKYLWNYGYDTEYLIGWSFAIFFIFSIINLTIYNKLLLAYSIRGFSEANFQNSNRYQRKYHIKLLNKFLQCLIFTGSIFWGIKFDVTKINLSKPLFIILILIEYITGIVFLTMIVHYVFKG